MVDFNIGALQPRLEPFVAENVSHQKVLKHSVSNHTHLARGSNSRAAGH